MLRLPFWIKSSTLASRDVTEEVWEQRPSSSCQNGYRSHGRTCVAGEDEEMGQMDGSGGGTSHRLNEETGYSPRCRS